MVPLLAALVAVVAVMGNGMLVLLCCPLWGELASETEEQPKPIFFVECPRFMALATGGDGKVRSRAGVRCLFIEAKRRPLTGSFRLR